MNSAGKMTVAWDGRSPVVAIHGSSETAVSTRFVTTYQTLRALLRRVRRRLQRQWKQSLAGVALLLTLGVTPTRAGTTITVPAGDTAALIQAINSANSETGDFVGPDTIELTTSTFTFTAPYGTTANALPVISSVITIVGNGSTITRDPIAPEFRLLETNSSGDLTLQDTTVSGGRAPGFSSDGGGIANAGSLVLVRSTVSGNEGNIGGGIVNAGSLVLVRSTVSGNDAAVGGGIGNQGQGTLTLVNTTVSGNTVHSFAPAGGIHLNSGVATLVNATVSGNDAPFNGGIQIDGGTMALTNTIVAGNSGGNCYGAITDGGHNLQSDDTSCGATIPVGNANLGPLQNNGGPTETHALLPGSNAIDAGNDTVCNGPDVNGVDQRGVARPQGTSCDIGAFELETDTAVTTAALLLFFDQSVADGTLQGVGSGSLARLRLKAMRLMLVVADELVERNRIRLACAELQLAYQLTDGQGRPNDLVTGPAAQKLAFLITTVRETLGCE
ncbi:MAG: choice-of-anchor Q domain-containing protein [Candidatus Binatia bacterium]